VKVLLTHERFLPDFGGGGEHLVAGIATNLARMGIEVRVLTTGPPALSSYDGIPIVRLPRHRYLFNLALPSILELAGDCDLIQTFNYHACLPSWLAGRWLGKPVVCLNLCVFEDAWLEMKGRFLGRAFKAIERVQLTRDFARLIFLCDHNLQSKVTVAGSTSRSIVIPPAIEVEKCAPAKEKEDVVLFTAKLDVRKRFEDVLAVAARLPHVRFRMLGWGPGAKIVQRLAGPNVEFLGFQEGEKFRDCFARARIFLLPSRAEGFPLVLLYAMASGCAVICTQPLRFEGMHVPVDDLDTLAAAVEQLWTDREGSLECGQRNVDLAQDYNWNRFMRSLVSVYREVLFEHANITGGAFSQTAGLR
jgi:glycosyltransferase involved in cell wall biosynthesis